MKLGVRILDLGFSKKTKKQNKNSVSSVAPCEDNKKYEAFGNLVWSSGTHEDNREFTSKEKDPTGFHYFGARYYYGNIGRFLSPDPHTVMPGNIDLSNPQELNPYVYCVNNPLIYVDPSGKFKMDAHWSALSGWSYTLEFTCRMNELSKIVPSDPISGIPALVEAFATRKSVTRKKDNLFIEFLPTGKLKNMEIASDAKMGKIFKDMFPVEKNPDIYHGIKGSGISGDKVKEFFTQVLDDAKSDVKLAEQLKELYDIETISDIDEKLEEANQYFKDSPRNWIPEAGGWGPE